MAGNSQALTSSASHFFSVSCATRRPERASILFGGRWPKSVAGAAHSKTADGKAETRRCHVTPTFESASSWL